jgi:hypothetical protein
MVRQVAPIDVDVTGDGGSVSPGSPITRECHRVPTDRHSSWPVVWCKDFHAAAPDAVGPASGARSPSVLA